MKKLLSYALIAIMTFALIPSVLAASVSGDWEYMVSDGGAVLTRYTGTAAIVTVPAGIGNYPVTELDGTFQGNATILSVVIPSGVQKIGPDAFRDCSHLAAVSLPATVTAVGDFAFQNCRQLVSLALPSAVSSLGAQAFAGCRALEEINLPPSITALGDNLFYDCQSLKQIILHPAITSVGNNTFRNCQALDTVHIPEKLISIRESAFSGCIALSGITVSEQNPVYASASGILFDKNRETLIRYPAGKTGASYSIPNSVTRISSYAFDGCTYLNRLSVPATVTSIDSSAFHGNTATSEIQIDRAEQGHLIWPDIGEYASRIVWRKKAAGPLTEAPAAEYMVTFVDGMHILKTQTVKAGGAATAPKTPKKTGYTFAGWDTKFQNVTGILIVRAKWKVNTVKITFRGNGGRIAGKKSKTIKNTYGQSLKLAKTPKRKGYTFQGWYTRKSGGRLVAWYSPVPASNKTYYARWKKNKR